MPINFTGRPNSCAIATAIPPFTREPSSFVSATPVTPTAPEQPRLLEPVLAGGRVDDEQRLVQRAGRLPLDHAPNLGELLHQVLLRVQTAGSVDDHDVDAVALCARSIAS